jgi:hypothetical protein
MGGEMHHRIDLMLRQQTRDQGVVAYIADDQLASRDGLLEALRQVVENDNSFAGFAQLFYDVTANVAGAAGDQNRPVCQNLSRGVLKN